MTGTKYEFSKRELLLLVMVIWVPTISLHRQVFDEMGPGTQGRGWGPVPVLPQNICPNWVLCVFIWKFWEPGLPPPRTWSWILRERGESWLRGTKTMLLEAGAERVKKVPWDYSHWVCECVCARVRTCAVLWFMESQRVGHNWTTDLIWSDVIP